jgi:pyruvate/2-oxoglutarate dehydrogenase complex dihydrolipoamide dehydrogenase (E3) component
MKKFDICVIGAGAGGLSVASGAAQLGMNVCLIEKDEMGGDCLNRGCVPSKALLHAAKENETYLMANRHVHESITKIAPHDSQERFEGLGCTVIREPVHFVSKHEIETASGQKIRAKYFVIAAGSRAFIPNIKGLDKDKILTNENIFRLEGRPDHLCIIGGGPVGVEMAQAHVKLGCAVTLITHGTILPKDDTQCVEIIRNQLIKDGIALHENVQITSVKHGRKYHDLKIKGGETVKATHILVATGRAPNIDTLHLSAAKVKFDDGGIKVNKHLRTNRKNIFALGDIIKDGPKFTHACAYQAGILIRNICFRMEAKVNYSSLPWVTYTSPELAHVGLTETQARNKYRSKNIRVLEKSLVGNDRAVTDKIHQGLIRIIGKQDGTILGASIVAPQAGEMIAPWCLAISKNMKMKDMASIILPYPTLSEIHKTIAGEWYKDQLFSKKTRFLVRLLQKLPRF